MDIFVGDPFKRSNFRINEQFNMKNDLLLFLYPSLKSKVKNKFLPSLYYFNIFWKKRNWFFLTAYKYGDKVVGIFSWYKYWLYYSRVNFFFDQINKFFLKGQQTTFISTNVKYYNLIKYYCEKLNCTYLLGFNKEMFSRFNFWQIIYKALDYNYKFFLPLISPLTFFIEGGIVRDAKYLKYFKANLSYLIGFSLHEWKSLTYDFEFPFTSEMFLCYSLSFTFNKLLVLSILPNKVTIPTEDECYEDSLEKKKMRLEFFDFKKYGFWRSS